MRTPIQVRAALIAIPPSTDGGTQLGCLLASCNFHAHLKKMRMCSNGKQYECQSCRAVPGSASLLQCYKSSTNAGFGTAAAHSQVFCSVGVPENFVARLLGRVAVKGKTLGVEVYEVLGLRSVVPTDAAEAAALYSRATRAFLERRFGEALELLKGCVHRRQLLRVGGIPCPLVLLCSVFSSRWLEIPFSGWLPKAKSSIYTRMYATSLACRGSLPKMPRVLLTYLR